MKVVLVDNDVALLRSLEIVLSSQGHEVSAFDDPRRACAALEAGASPDVLALDCVMPELSGLEVFERVRDALPKRCKVVFISGHTDQIDSESVMRRGAHGFLAKPLDLDALSRFME